MTPFLKYKFMSVLISMLEYNPLFCEMYDSIFSVFSVNGKVSNIVATQADILNEINLATTASDGTILDFAGVLSAQLNLVSEGKISGVIGFLSTLYFSNQISSQAKKDISIKLYAYLKNGNNISINAEGTSLQTRRLITEIQNTGTINSTFRLFYLANLLYLTVKETIQTSIQSVIKISTPANFSVDSASETLVNAIIKNVASNKFNSKAQVTSSVIANFVVKELATLNYYSNSTLMQLLDNSLLDLKFI